MNEDARPRRRGVEIALVVLALVAVACLLVATVFGREFVQQIFDRTADTDVQVVRPAESPDVSKPSQTTTIEPASELRKQADALLAEVQAAQIVPEPPEDSTTEPAPPVLNHEPPEVILAGEDWFGGHGVNVCSGSTVPSCGGEEPVGTVKYNWWQCVELAQRHYNAMGWFEGRFGTPGAIDIYHKAEELGMETQPFDDVQRIASGDMIVHNSAGYDSADMGYGHVSVVNYSVGNIHYAVEQNANKSGRAVYIVIDNTLVRMDVRDGELVTSINTVKGVVHSPKNTANEPRQMREGFDEKEFETYLAEVKKAAV